ncbi:NrtR DNA-binding winged helix domain-containing protein [Gordonia sp. DT30]|uniref:NrtR DNA-binding winged helix domain-containing protein n=1 Tax=unclassified Gordonia (in: high G+C Gram-positive bacteria) TaxID=2657482 RepID=UPI003CF6BB19
MAAEHISRLTDYPRPSVAVDIAVLSVVDAELCVVIQRDDDGTAMLPGRFIRERRRVADTVREVLELKLGLSPDHVHPHLLQVFDDPDRDRRGWTVSIAHAVALPAAALTDVVGEPAPVTASGALASGEPLLYDHDRIIAAATDSLRRRYEDRPDPDNLLPTPYTLTELRELHEAILGRRLMRDSFNRRVQPLLAAQTDRSGQPVTRVAGGRPARLYAKNAPPTATFGWKLPSKSDE